MNVNRLTPSAVRLALLVVVPLWANWLAAAEPMAPPAGFRPLFDGKSLEGWEGSPEVFRVEEGIIVGEAKEKLDKNQFLATRERFQDFYLRVKFRLVNNQGNSGIQFRSERIPNHHEMIGYQADIGQQFWGCLYDESRRNRVLVQPAAGWDKDLDKSDWCEYAIRCMNNQILMVLNDRVVVSYQEQEANIAGNGHIALQVHSANHPIRVEFKDVFIQELPVLGPAADDVPGFQLRTSEAGGKTVPYSLFLPKDYFTKPDKKWPTILFLHGAGERGADGQLSAKVGLGPAVAARADTFPFIVVMPQAKETWRADSDDAAAAIAILDEVQTRFRVDQRQVHVTGLSMGGAGAWGLGAKYPDRWATVSSLCGFGDLQAAKTLSRRPTWVFCGDKDGERVVKNCREISEAIRQAGGEVQYTEYPNIGHNCWDLAYNHDALYEWMLAHPLP